MIRLDRFARRLFGSLRRRRAEVELEEEIRFHIEMETEANRERGLPPDEAGRAARRSFGRVAQTLHECQEARGLPWLEDAAGDTKLAFRSIRRAPAFAGAVILLMALGIGANAAVYTVVDGVLLRSLPYPDPHEMAQLRVVGSRGTTDWHDGALVGELRRWTDPTQRIAAHGLPTGLNLVDGELALHVQAIQVSHEYLDVLGIRPETGHAFDAADERVGAAPVAILGHALARRLGGDVVGRRVLLGGTPHRIAGVLARGVRTDLPADLLIPFRMGAEATGRNYRVLARLMGGPAPAEQRRTAATAALHESGALDRQLELRWVGLHEAKAESRRGSLFLLFAAVGLVLLIACANVAGLLAIKARRRRGELAVRAALGAGPGRLVRQLLTEAMVYAVLGGLLGILLAEWGLAALLRLAPSDLAEWDLGIDGRVLVFCAALTVATGILCGVIPALRASRVDLRQAVGGAATGIASSSVRNRWRRAMLAGQLALSTLLLLGAGLLLRTLVALRAVDPGFEPGDLLALTMSPTGGADDRSLPTFFDQAFERAGRIPGVRRVALAGAVPGRRGLNLPMRLPDGEFLSVGWRYVTPGYFELLHIPVERGRGLSERDTRSSESVVVVNRALARRLFGDGDPIGRSIQVERFAPEIDGTSRTIVGVVGDTRDDGPRADPEPRMYVAAAQVPSAMLRQVHEWFDACWLLETDLAPAVAAERMGDTFRTVRPGIPVSEAIRLEDVVADQRSGERFLASLLAAFALAGLFVAATGVYGLTAYSVGQRSREIAIRMALGATPSGILRGVIGEGLLVAASGIAAGLILAWPLRPVVDSFLYGASSTDPITTSLVVAAMLATALVASIPPAARAARIDPGSNLRQG